MEECVNRIYDNFDMIEKDKECIVKIIEETLRASGLRYHILSRIKDKESFLKN